MSIFKRLWATPEKTMSTSEVTIATAATFAPGAVERRSRKRLDARKGIRALIIDDSPTIVAALRKILRSAGYVTLEAPDAEQGLALVLQEIPDLIFLDIILPGMNGFGALRAIRKDPLAQHIPVIMISGNEHATEQFYANRIGADDFMKKPFSRFEVFARVECLLDGDRVPRRKTGVPGVTLATPQPVPPVLAAAPVVSELHMSVIEARTALTAMGLQYFDQGQYAAAIRRGDQLAMDLFVCGGGVQPEMTGGSGLLPENKPPMNVQPGQ